MISLRTTFLPKGHPKPSGPPIRGSRKEFKAITMLACTSCRFEYAHVVLLAEFEQALVRKQSFHSASGGVREVLGWRAACGWPAVSRHLFERLQSGVVESGKQQRVPWIRAKLRYGGCRNIADV